MTTKSQHKIINWGIIGLGNIANKFAQDLLTIPDTKLYAVASRSQDKADNFASKYNATKAYGDYESLAADSNIDAVYIATPHALHKDNTLLCLEHDIPVLCEKPFAMNAHEVAIMIAKAKEKNIRLTTHPSQFILLSSPNNAVTEKSIEDLNYHAYLNDLMGADVINIHVGGAYGNKEEAIKRVKQNFDKLALDVRSKLTFENDDI